MLDKTSIKVFVDSLTNYFPQIGATHVEVGTPYLQEVSRPPSSDLTGVINVSGIRNGSIYFSCPEQKLGYLLKSQGETEYEDELLEDLVGEVANTIAGNARAAFGSDFVISVPRIVRGALSQVRLPENIQCVVIPIYWQRFQSVIVMALD